MVDAAMNDLIRPALYSAHHQVLPLHQPGHQQEERDLYDVVGKEDRQYEHQEKF